jgi:hypothetical protein
MRKSIFIYFAIISQIAVNSCSPVGFFIVKYKTNKNKELSFFESGKMIKNLEAGYRHGSALNDSLIDVSCSASFSISNKTREFVIISKEKIEISSRLFSDFSEIRLFDMSTGNSPLDCVMIMPENEKRINLGFRAITNGKWILNDVPDTSQINVKTSVLEHPVELLFDTWEMYRMVGRDSNYTKAIRKHFKIETQ